MNTVSLDKRAGVTDEHTQRRSNLNQIHCNAQCITYVFLLMKSLF